jgi:hypothetical protein
MEFYMTKKNKDNKIYIKNVDKFLVSSQCYKIGLGIWCLHLYM